MSRKESDEGPLFEIVLSEKYKFTKIESTRM